MFFTGAKISTSMEDAAIEEARKRPRGERLGNAGLRGERLGNAGLRSGVDEGGGTGGGFDAAVSAASATVPPAPTAAASPNGSSVCSSGVASNSVALRSGLVPVNTDPVVAMLTFRVACILQWVRIYGSDFISAKNCFKDSPQGKVLPMRHPLRDLPSLLLRFGAIPKPVEGSSHSLEWEEWPEGDEAAVKLPDDARARFFGLGRTDERQGGTNRGHVGGQGRFKKAFTRGARLPPNEFRPVVRCKADADFLVEFACVLIKPPACGACSKCVTIFISHLPFITLIANYAYRPATVLLNRFLSVFPPHSDEFKRLLNRLGLDAPHCSVHAVRERVEQVPISFLLSLAMNCPKPLLQGATEGQHSPRAGGRSSGPKERARGRRAGSGDSGDGGDGEGDCGDVWEDVQSWFMVAMMPPAMGVQASLEACRGSRSREIGTLANEEEVIEMCRWSAFPRFCEDMEREGGSASPWGSRSKRKGKKADVPAYLKPWPGGVNLVACLREMLLGQPCYRPPSCAASSTPAAVSTAAASLTSASRDTANSATTWDAPIAVAAPSTTISAAI
ncbi:hypothetical protein CLOM_g8176 [Closterium sp. NIES-68]|nr:hypothetical protein CLOM_g17699 [Closterium sp. NIES-68]GJP48910.1 hypothetical protein CLOM_g8176 [Closterium sp. NIES-68]GJP69653.1 hypothetical protein CLOP_g640 [Closterium sp. NIES-67]